MAAPTSPNPISRKRPRPCYQRWDHDDEVLILTALAANRRESGRLPASSALLEDVRGKGLRRQNPTALDLARKVHCLVVNFRRAINAGGPGGGAHDQRLYQLSAEVWPDLLPPQ